MLTLESQIESILFVSDKPLSIKKLALLTGASSADVMVAIEKLSERFGSDVGIVLLVHNDAVQLTTHPGSADTIASLLREDTIGELTRPALETLSVVSYRGPVAKSLIEEIRGVNCTLALRNLMIRGLIEVAEDSHGEKLYSVSMQYLRHLGIASIADLPNYRALHDETKEAPSTV